MKYKYKEQNLQKIGEKEKAYVYYFFSCIELNDGTIDSEGNGAIK